MASRRARAARAAPAAPNATDAAVKAASEAAYDDELELLVSYFEDAEQTSTKARQLSERDRDYYDNKQLTAAELNVLRSRGQPDVVINRIQTKVNYLLGYEASQRTDPRAYPRTPQDEDASEACTDTLRYVRDKVDLAQIFSLVWEHMLIEGNGGAEFGVEPDGQGDAEISGKGIHWDRLFADPHSREHDYEDARYKGLVVWMDQEEAEQRWPNGQDAIARAVMTATQSQTYDDRPHWQQWAVNGKRKRIRVVQMYHKKGDVWHWCIFTRGGKLAGGEVPYKNQDNKSLCPLLMQSAFVDRDNNRYGFVRALISPQDEINKRRSKSLHLLMGKPVIMEDGAVEDEDATRTEMGRANGLIKVNPGFRFEFGDNSQELQGHLGLLQESKQEIDLMGPNAAMQGKGDRSASGRAIIANQQGGQIEIYRLTDRHNHFKRKTYELIWAMIQQYWSAKKMVRVTDDEKNIKFVGLNRPVILAEDLLKKAIANGVDEQDAKAQLAQQAQDPYVRQQLQQVVRQENVPAEMVMDIRLEEVPDTANMQQEQFEIMTKLAPAVVFPPEMYIEMSALRNKRQLLEKFEKAKENPEAQQAAQLKQTMAQAEIENQQAETAKLVASIAELKAQTQLILQQIKNAKATEIKTMAEADATDAQTGQVVLPQVTGQPPAWDPDLAPQPPPQFPGYPPVGTPVGMRDSGPPMTGPIPPPPPGMAPGMMGGPMPGMGGGLGGPPLPPGATPPPGGPGPAPGFPPSANPLTRQLPPPPMPPPPHFQLPGAQPGAGGY